MPNPIMDTFTPKISVIITTYNGETYLEQQLLTVFNQTLQPAEIIVCDDGSTDGTLKILQKWVELGKIQLYKNNTILGVVENFKKGVLMANPSNFIAFCDQDDLWLPNKLLLCWEKMELIHDPQIPCLVYSDLVLVDKNLNVINNSFQNELGIDKFKHCFETALFGSLVLGCTSLINPVLAKFFIAIPKNNNYYHDAWMSLIAFGFGKHLCIKEPLVKYRQHNNNITISMHSKRNRITKLITHLKHFFGKSKYLLNELALANDFDNAYYYKLPSHKQILIKSFLALENKPHFVKKWAFEKTFFRFWIKRF